MTGAPVNLVGHHDHAFSAAFDEQSRDAPGALRVAELQTRALNRGEGIVRQTITQFMWGYQSHFRMSLEGLAEESLREIGLPVGPRAYLVGFADNAEAPFDICIEPESGPFQQVDLAGVLFRTEELYASHEDRHTIHTHPSAHEQYHTRLQDECRRLALSEALAAAPGGAGREFFCGPGVPIAPYRVYPVVGVVASRWRGAPALTSSSPYRISVHQSLQHAVIDNVLRAAARALACQTPPSTIIDGVSDGLAIARIAASEFVDGIVARTGQFVGSGFRDALDSVSAQPYEGRAGVGSLVLAPRGHESVEVDIAFEQQVSVRSTRALRKVLEMSDPDLHLLTDGRDVYGMGRLADSYASAGEECFGVTVVGRGSWELAHNGTPLLRVNNGSARLPREPISKERFVDTVIRSFQDADATSADLLWSLAGACADQTHGTMLVVHPSAADEGARLLPQALTIEPRLLEGSALRAVTSIDGAVLVSPDGLCHAVGVILDGLATGTGAASRGARYNSAVRYLAGGGKGSLVIIVSEDGTIDLLPTLRRRVRREEVEAAVDRMVSAAAGDVEFEEFHRREDHVRALAFYLNADQCEAVNSARAAVEELRWQQSQMRIHYSPIQPNDEMDDSYFE